MAAYIGYLPDLYYWDILTFLRNITLSVIIVFLDSTTSDGNYQQGLAALLVFLTSTALHFACLPYEVKELNYLEGGGLVVSMMTLYLGLWTFSITWALSSIIISVLIFLINIIWLLCVLAVLSSSFGSKVQMIVTKLRNSFITKGIEEGKAGMKNTEDVIVNVESSHDTKGSRRVTGRFTNQENGLEMGNLSKVLRDEGAKTKKKEKEKEKGNIVVVNPLLATKT